MNWLLAIASLGADASIAELEHAVLASRQRITSGIVRIESVAKIRMRAGGGGESRTRKATIYFDKDRFRGDFLKHYDGADERTYVESAVFTADGMLFYSNKKAGAIENQAVVKVPLTDLYAEAYVVPDPRLIGMAPATFMNLKHFTLDSFIGKVASEKRASVESATYLGAACRVLRCQWDGGIRFEAWIDPQRDHNVVRMELEFAPYRESIECALAHVAGFGWFPSRVLAKRFHNDQPETEEVLHVKVEQFNQELPPETFTFAGMGVPKGRTVIDETSGRSEEKTWDGSKLVDKIAEASPAAVDATHAGELFFLANGVLLALIAGAMLWRWKRRGMRP